MIWHSITCIRWQSGFHFRTQLHGGYHWINATVAKDSPHAYNFTRLSPANLYYFKVYINKPRQPITSSYKPIHKLTKDAGM